MPFYETTFITRQDLSKQDVTKLTETFSGFITANGGKVVKTEYWGLRPLAYRINKNRKGHYTLIASDAPPAALKEMERNMGINEEVMRVLTVRVEEISEQPSALLNNRSEESSDEAFTPAATTEAVA